MSDLQILDYLKKEGPTNSFRLAHKLRIDRYKLLDILKKLEEKQAIRFEQGNAIFIKFISEEKPKPTKIKEPFSKPKKKVEVKRKPAKSKALKLLQTENKQLREKLAESEDIIKELGEKTNARPKTVTRTITKTIIKKVPIVKTIIKRIPVPLPKPERKIKEQTKKKWFKLPKFKFMRGIKNLKIPKFAIQGGR